MIKNMKRKIVEYSVVVKTYGYNQKCHMYESQYDIISKNDKPITFKDIQRLKSNEVMTLLFWHKYEVYDDNGKPTEYIGNSLDKKYILGKSCKYNEIPKDVRICPLDDIAKKHYVELNPEFVITRQNLALLNEYIPKTFINDKHEIEVTEIIDPNDLDSIKEISVNSIEYFVKSKE